MEKQNDSSNKDQILSHFQEVTDLYDVEQSQVILESTNWNLDQAIQSFFSGDVNTLTSPTINKNNDLETNTDKKSTTFKLNELITNGASNYPLNNINFDHYLNENETTQDLSATTKTILSSNPKRLLTFNIEFYTKKFQLFVADSHLVSDLKNLISGEIKLPYKYQKLKGWKNKDSQVLDHMELSSLNLPLENNLFVINTNTNFDFKSAESTIGATTSSSSKASANLNIDLFELTIKIIINKNLLNINESRVYRLQFDPTIKFVDVKRKISKLAEINVNQQEWWFSQSLINWNANDKEDELECSSLEKLIENGHVLSLPLTLIIKNDASLNEIEHALSNLSELNTKLVISSSDMQKSLLFNNLNQTNLINSKLTPDKSIQKLHKLSFIVTFKASPELSEQIMPLKINNTLNINEDFDYFEDDDIEEQFEINSGFETENKVKNNKLIKEDTNDENDDLDEDDISDNFVLDTVSKQKSLIPASLPAGDEFFGTTLFVEEFFNRYQPIIPLFYIGTLENAIKESLLCSARNRKLLGIYLHSDKSVCRHIFCSKTFCDENVVNFLISNFIVWGWDLTNAEHEANFFTNCSKFLGSVVTNQLKNNQVIYPAFLIVNRMRGTNEVLSVIQGDSSQDTMMNGLMQAYEIFEAQRFKDEKEEQTRDEREQIKREQDAAYHQSLELDKAKRQKQTEEFERQKEAARVEEENEKQKMFSKTNYIKNCLESLKNEPDENMPINKITKIRFRLPNGETIQRRFLISDKLQEIVYFVEGNGYFNEEFKLISSWPRKDLTSPEQDKDQTIEELKLYPQETLTVEKR